MKTLIALTLMALFMSKLSSFMPQEQSQGRIPASIEKRVTAEERKQRIEEERQLKELNEKYELLLKLQGELAEIEKENAQLQEGLAFFQSQLSPMNSLGDNNEGLANYLRLQEVNQGYNMKDFESLISYGEMQSPAEALYYGMPYASRESKSLTNENSSYVNPYYQIEALQGKIIEVY